MNAKEWYDLFVGKVTHLMRIKGLSPAELAQRIGADENTVIRWIDGQRIPSAPAVVRMAKALEVDVKELIDFG